MSCLETNIKRRQTSKSTIDDPCLKLNMVLKPEIHFMTIHFLAILCTCPTLPGIKTHRFVATKLVTPVLNRMIVSRLEIHLGCVKRIWCLSHMRAAKVQASLRIRAVSPDPSLLAHSSSESRGTFRQKTRSLAPMNGWVCAVKICHDGMLEDTNSRDVAYLMTITFSGHTQDWSDLIMQ